MLSLTKREKFLIHLLIVLVIFLVGGRFLVYPSYVENAKIRELSSKVVGEKVKAENLIKGKENSEKTLEDLNTQYASKYSLVIEPSKNEKIDMMITSLCVQNGLKPKSLLITDDTSSGEENKGTIIKKKITVEAEENYEGLTDLIEKTNKLSYMTIDKFSINMEKDTMGMTKDMKIDFSLYMRSQNL